MEELHTLMAKRVEGTKLRLPKKVKLSGDQFVEMEKSYDNARRKLDRVVVETLVTPEELRRAVDSLDKGEYKMKTAKTELVELSRDVLIEEVVGSLGPYPKPRLRSLKPLPSPP